MVLIPACASIGRSMKSSHGTVEFAQAVQDDMAMQVAGVVVAVRVRDGQRLMPREKAVGKLHANRLRLSGVRP